MIPQRVKCAAAIAFTLTLLFAFLAATPTGRVLAQNVLRFFSRNGENATIIPTVDAGLQPQPAAIASTLLPEGGPDAVAPEGCGTVRLPRCTLADVQPEVPFPLRMPADLPPGMAFSGAVPIQGGALLKFEGQAGILLLAETLVEPNPGGTWAIGSDTTVETVLVGNQPAEYVQGGWIGLGLAEEGSLPWDKDFPTRTLRWQADGLQYTLVNFPHSSADGPRGLDLSQMQALAGSLNTSQKAASSRENGGLTLQQAQEKAGFLFAEPARLPVGLTLSKITYDSQHNAICQYYYDHAHDSAPTLVIAQSNWALPPVSELQAKAFYDGKEVAIALMEQSMPIAGAAGGQGAFIESGLQVDAFCGGEEATANRALLWQAGERTNVLFAQLDANDGRGYVTVQEMRRIAETINGADPAADIASDLDPERLLSLDDAETLTGLDIHLPALMLSNVRFDHISYGVDGMGPGYISAYYAGEPVGDGRTYHVQIIQSPDAETNLDILEMAGGYERVAVRGHAGIYQAQCFDTTELAGGVECHQYLTWFEVGTQFDVSAYFPALVPRETLFAIAESMR